MTQLFPSITPYNVQNARAHPGYNTLGNLVSAQAAKVRPSVNATVYAKSGGYSAFDAASFTTPNGSNITWPELYGPQQYHGDNFTNLFGRRYFDAEYTEAAGNIVVSGYGDEPLPPQPFQADNMLLLSNGACDSACALFVHFLKWQGKVKQVALGGRPQNGPMQAVGGTRGTQVEAFSDLFGFTQTIISLATADIIAQINATELGTIARKGAYVLARAVDFGSGNVNFYNHIAQDDMSLTPLQFTYEAADCRLFYTAETAINASANWAKVAEVWKSGFSDCVPGSAGQPSSLSGDAQLYEGGAIANISTSGMPGNAPTQTGSQSPVSISAADAGAGASVLYGVLASVVALYVVGL